MLLFIYPSDILLLFSRQHRRFVMKSNALRGVTSRRSDQNGRDAGDPRLNNAAQRHFTSGRWRVRLRRLDACRVSQKWTQVGVSLSWCTFDFPPTLTLALIERSLNAFYHLIMACCSIPSLSIYSKNPISSCSILSIFSLLVRFLRRFARFMVLERLRHVFASSAGLKFDGRTIDSSAFQRIGRKLKVLMCPHIGLLS